MVDPVSVGLMVAGLFATKLVEGAGGEAGRRLVGAAAGVLDRVRAWATGDERLETAVQQVEKDPKDQPAVQLLGARLEQAAAADPAIAKELAELAESAESQGFTY